MEEYSVIVVSLSLTSVVLKLYANSDGAQQEENKNNPETTIERHLETVKILMSWNVQQQTNKRARKRTPAGEAWSMAECHAVAVPGGRRAPARGR